MGTEFIERFLRPPEHGGSYTDEKLAALLAHTEEGKLCYNSCDCLIGIPSATHALRTEEQFMNGGDYDPHYVKARAEPFAMEAEMEFAKLGSNDAKRRERLLPLIHAEIARRDNENWKAAQEEPEMLERMAK